MSSLPVALPLRGLVVFPGMIRIMPVGRPTSIRAIERHIDEGVPLVLLPQVDTDEDDPLHAQVAKVGVLGRILRLTRLPDSTMRVLVEGIERVGRVGELDRAMGSLVVAIERLEPVVREPALVGAMAQELADLYQDHTQAAGLQPHEHWAVAPSPDDPERLADQVLAATEASLEDRIAALEDPVLDNRVERAIAHLARQVARHRIASDVNARVQRAMDDSQREYHLKEQLKAIRTELGEASGAEADAAAFEDRIRQSGMPKEVEEESLREVARLRRVHTDSAEYTIIRTWLEAVCDVPWQHATSDTTSIKKAQKVLDRDHHGLDFVKERLLEYLAVRQLAPDSKGPILCFVGPPGVGKTSLGMSIAKALGRNFGRIALGGVKDETEIRGHRRTYVGALPGRILRALIRSKSKNPVLVLDEIDKVGNDFRGDPASALLEVLDPEQNSQFVDHYLDVPVDLSQVLFIATANLMDPIPPALFDRLEIIEIPGYTEEEKVTISRKHLLPKLAKNHGLGNGEISVETGAIQRTIRDYTREAGLRELERQLARLNRKVARRVVEEGVRKVRILSEQLPRYLGPPKYFQELAELEPRPGVVIGLAWTAAGGDILFVEAARMPGKATLKLTGSLGEVMKESAEAALSWLRAHGQDYGIGVDAFDAEFHLHVPAGAIPKDGPSAGVTMVTALASLVSDSPVRDGLAMTGEITLRGKVLPVGGIKEKALAARRAGVRTMLLPTHNRNDLQDIPEELQADLEFVFVDRIDQVLEAAIGLAPRPRTTRAAAASASRRVPGPAGRPHRRSGGT
ncbi:MAG: endopeptidase La [Myxococcales bacterium]|nr:endopeptidase La [Myxococcales bacterium]